MCSGVFRPQICVLTEPSSRMQSFAHKVEQNKDEMDNDCFIVIQGYLSTLQTELKPQSQNSGD